MNSPMSNDNPTRNGTPEKKDNAGKRKVLFMILGALLLGGALFMLLKPKVQTTDNAQVRGHIRPLAPRVAGHVAAVLFEENQPVKAGQTLIVLDSADAALRVRMAKAALEAAKAQVHAAEQEFRNAQDGSLGGDAAARSALARVASAEANTHKLELDLARARELRKGDVIPQSDLDGTQAAYDAALAQLHAAQADAQNFSAQRAVTSGRVESAKAQLDVLHATLDARQADLDNALLQLSYCVIKAPCDGVTGRRNAEVGQQVGPGQPLGAVVDTTDIWVAANFKETQLEDIHIGQHVKIKVDAYPGDDLSGEVESISEATGAQFTLLPPDNATGNFVKVTQRIPVRVRITERPADHPLAVGMNVTVKVSTGS